MKKITLILVLLWLITPIFSQDNNKKQLTIETCITDYNLAYPNYMHKMQMVKKLQWIPETDYFTYVNFEGILVKQKANSDKSKELLSNITLNKICDKQDFKKFAGINIYKWLDNNIIMLENENNIYTYNLKKKKLEVHNSYTSDAENVDICKKTFAVAYTKENNLYIANNNKEIAITAEKNKGIVYGQVVHRNEFGITKGTFWAPNGSALAFYKKDENEVTDYPLVDILVPEETRIAQKNMIKYPMAGMKSHHVTIGVYNLETQKTIYLKTGTPADKFLTNVAWGPYSKFIYIAVLNREQNKMELNQYSATTGEYVKTLFTESNEKYVEPTNTMYFIPNNTSQFIWQSEKSGYNHLYLYDTTGKMIKQVTSGNYDVTNFIGIYNDFAFYESTEASPLERHVYSVHLKSGKKNKITQQSGTHSAVVSSNGKYAIDFFTSHEVPSEIRAIDTEQLKVLQTISTFESGRENYNLPEIKIGTLKSKDSTTDLYYRLILPNNIDKTKKYPVMLYVYGGPHMQMITNTQNYGASLFDLYMAQKGYIVISIDNRGSDNRGRAFEDIIHRNCGSIEVEDQMQGIEFLKQQSYVDTNRIGVFGWSYGGFMSLSLKTAFPDIFKVSVAGGPVIDWKYYEIMYGERYMDTPEENPEGYKNSCLLNKVDKINEHVMIIHGTHDPVVLWQNSLKFIRKCIDKNKQIDYFVYPHDEHNMFGKDRIHLLYKVSNYFDDYL